MKSKLVGYDLDLYEETLDNGLKINIVPKSNVNNIYVTFSTKYGSVHDTFIPINKNEFYKVPMGVAHFLEHKVFEQADGKDPFTFFSSNGADANASTSYYKTTYLFSGPTHFKQNLNFLLNYVQAPYFTDENVEKEKGIITQEIKMLKDNPNWQLYDKSLSNSFINHPIKYPIGGTVESIAKITKDDLYTCYNTFYHPSNMFITITGKVDPKKTISYIKENQEKKKFASFKPIVLKEYDEPDNVALEYEEINKDVSIPKASLCYKISSKNYDINRLSIYLNTYFSLLVGNTSFLVEQLKKEKLISNGINFDVVSTDKHLLYMVEFESEKYQEVLERLKDVIGKQRITSEELNRKKKAFRSSCIYRSDNIFAINNRINNNIINYDEIIKDEFALIDSLNMEELNDILDNISFKETCVVVIQNN